MTNPNPQVAFQNDLDYVLEQIGDMLIAKNKKYGDAALNPNQTFSSCDAVELIRVRIDDKLSRIRNRNPAEIEDEDVKMDLIGYLIIERIAIMRYKPKPTITGFNAHQSFPPSPLPIIDSNMLNTATIREAKSKTFEQALHEEFHNSIKTTRPNDGKFGL